MSTVELLVLALALAMDASSVSVTNGMCFKNLSTRQMLLIPFSFGLAQFIMPIIGYFGGVFFSSAIESVDHWIAFGILFILGSKMIYEAVKSRLSPDESKGPSVLTGRLLLVQSVATSIDALIIGISFAVIQADIWVASSFIGVITFICCMISLLIGCKFGDIFRGKAEIFGGIILIFIGFKTLFEHIL